MVHMHSGNLLEEHTFFAEEVPLPVPLVLGLLGLVLAAATFWLAVLPAPLHTLTAMGFGKDGTPTTETAVVASPPAPLPAPLPVPVPASPPPVAAPSATTPSVAVPSVAAPSVVAAPAAPAAVITVPVPPAPGVVPPPAPVVSAPVAVVALPSPPPAQTLPAVVDAPVPPVPPVSSASSASAARSSPCAPLFAVAFDLAEAEPLAPELPARVDRLAAWLQAHPQARLIIEGHTDTSGSEAYNLALSQRRAMAVAHLLLATGTSADRLVTRGFGGERPLDGVSGRSGRNRRVAMRIAGAPECPAPTVQEAR